MGDAALEHASEPVIQLANCAGSSSETFRANQRACNRTIRTRRKYACNREIRRRPSDGGLSCVGLMTEITDGRDGKRSGLQNKCPVSGILDLRQFICALRCQMLLQSGYLGDDVEMRERTTK